MSEGKQEARMDTHKLGACLRFANGETCIGCGDERNGEPLSKPIKEREIGKWATQGLPKGHPAK